MENDSATYKKELEEELERLIRSQAANPSEYKEERIKRLQNRLTIGET